MKKGFTFAILLNIAFAFEVLAMPVDNLHFSIELADTVVGHFFKGVQINGEGFVLKSESTHPANFIVEQSLINYIKKNGGDSYLDSVGNRNSSDTAGFLLCYKILKLGLKYDRAGANHPKGKKIWRKGEIGVIFQLVSKSDGKVIKYEETSAERADFLSKKEATQFSANGDFYITPEMPTGFKRFFEPAIVGITTATLIFLFFSNR